MAPSRTPQRPRTALPPQRRAPGPGARSQLAGGPRTALQEQPPGVQTPSSALEVLLQADLVQWYVRSEWTRDEPDAWTLTVSTGRRQTPAEAARRPNGGCGRWLYTLTWRIPDAGRGRWDKTRSRYQTPAMRDGQTVQVGTVADVLQTMQNHPTPLDLR